MSKVDRIRLGTGEGRHFSAYPKNHFGHGWHPEHGRSYLECAAIHSAASFWASAIWAGVMSEAIMSRLFPDNQLPPAAAMLNHLWAST